MTREELKKLESYLRTVFKNDAIEIRPRPQKADSAEVYIADEFIGLMYQDEQDEDDDEVSYSFQMAILDFDLEQE